MFDAEPDPLLAKRVRTLQIIVAAMALGVLVFLAIVLVVPAEHTGPAEPGDPLPIVTTLALAEGLAAFFIGPLLSGVVVTIGRRKLAASAPSSGPTTSTGLASRPATSQGDADKLMGLYTTKTLIGAAIYEAAALFLCAAYLVEHNRLVPILAALLAAGLLVQIPTHDRVQQWLDEQRREL